MVFTILLIIFIISLTGYVLFSSYSFQSFIYKKKLKKDFIEDLRSEVKGIHYKDAYFAHSHKTITKKEFNSFNERHKGNFSQCYNLITFKTPDANWELFFQLIKEGVKHDETLNLRVFPKNNRIKSEGNVEKNYSRLNIFTNNRYLTNILEEQKTTDYLKWLIRHNEDILLISHSNLHFKALLLGKNKITKTRIMDMIKSINYIKNKIYKEEVIEY